MKGMEDEVMEAVEGGQSEGDSYRIKDGDYDSKPIWARAIVISAGVIMNLVFAFLIYAGTAAYYGVEELDTTRVMSVDQQGLPAGTEALADFPSGANIVRIGAEEPETWTDVQTAFLEAPSGPLEVAVANPEATFSITVPSDEASRRDLVLSLNVWYDAVIAVVEPGAPASDGGIELGDRLVSIDGVPIQHWDDVTREVGARPDTRVEVILERDGATLTRSVELASVEDDESGELRGRMGVSPELPGTVSASVSLGEALSIGWGQTLLWSGAILDFLRDLFTGNVSPRSVGSIGTIAQASGEAAASGVSVYLKFMAFFSINLAILNLLPIPILDGGHLVFLFIELVRGEAVSIEQRMRWSQVGLVVVAGIMVWALGNDLLRFLGL